MAITVSGTTITFNDGTTQSTAASAGSTTYGTVGTYTWAVLNNNVYTGTNYQGGDTFPGQYIWPCGIVNYGSGGYYPVLDFLIATTFYTGTWQLMSLNRGAIYGSGRAASLFVRIA